MRLNEFTNEALEPGHKAAIKGMHRLSGDQYYGMYKTMNDVAGHDGKKQTAPSGGTDDEVSDKPFAYAYTDEEEKMLKAVDPKAERVTSSKSEELDEGVEEAYEPVYAPHGTNRSGIFSPNRGIARRSLTAVNKFLEKPFTAHHRRTDFLLSLVPDRKLKELVGVLAYEHFPFDDLRELPWFMRRLNSLIARAEQRLNQDVKEGSEEDYKTQRMWDQHDDDTEDLGIVGQGEHWAGIRRNKQRRLDKEQKKGVAEGPEFKDVFSGGPDAHGWDRYPRYDDSNGDVFSQASPRKPKKYTVAKVGDLFAVKSDDGVESMFHTIEKATRRADYINNVLGGVTEAGDNYHANRTGFAKPQGHRDDERHDLDVARPLIYGLKINGKIWQKDGNTVTFFTKERALAARNAILAKRPDVEVGLVQRPKD